jgi:peptidoglycan/xylan/chitin deacetylase (PgdA/CDA1 family)
VIAVSSILRRAVYPAMSRAGLFSGRVRPGDVCILTYHGVLPQGSTVAASPAEGTLVSAEQFRRQLRFLKSRYELITPEAFRSRWSDGTSLPAKAVLLTCDDGFLNVLTDMVPILLEEGARCLFLVTGASLTDAPACLWYEELYRMLDDAPGDSSLMIGLKSTRKDSLAGQDMFRYWWDLVHELSSMSSDERRRALDSLRSHWRLSNDWRMYDPADARAERRHRLLNRTELQQLVAQGMTIGAHTMSHPILTQMAPELAEREMRECREGLESLLRREVWALAYPFGHEGSARSREMRMAAEAGYTCALLNYGGGVSRETSPRFALPRAHVTAEMALPEFEAHLSGFHEHLQKRFHRGGGDVAAEEAKPSCN